MYKYKMYIHFFISGVFGVGWDFYNHSVRVGEKKKSIQHSTAVFEWQYCIDGETPNIDILLNKLKWSWSTVKRELISCSTEITYMKSTRPKNHPMMDTADNVNSKQPNSAITQVKFCLCRHNIYTHTHTHVCICIYNRERVH